jgi:hypothetical protein
MSQVLKSFGFRDKDVRSMVEQVPSVLDRIEKLSYK